MRRLFQQLTSGELGARLNTWIIRILTRPAVSRRTCGLIVAALVILIGIADYLSGTTISLQVVYMVPIAMALAWLGFFAAFITSVCSIAARVGGDYILGGAYTRSPTIVWNVAGFLATYVVFAWILQSFIMLRQELEERVRSRTDALAREIRAREKLQQELSEISERERRSIGKDLHDGLGQHLTALAFASEVLARQMADSDPLAPATAQEIGRLAEEGVKQSRQLARGLLLGAIEPASLSRELEELAASMQRQTGVRCRYEAVSPPLVSSSSTASHIFHIAQEAVHHSIRHAQPTALHLSLHGGEQELVLAISDNGTAPTALTAAQAATRLEMEHRARLIGADFTLDSKPGHSTHLFCRIPLGNPAVHSHAL